MRGATLTLTRYAPLARYAPLVLIVPLAVVNFYLVGLNAAVMVTGSDALDFAIYQLAIDRYPDGTLYDEGPWFYVWRYSPIAVYPLALVAWIGETAWRALHFVALIALPGWTRLIALASYPFWFDVAAGNVMIFIVVLAFWAMRGNRWATGGLLVTALLIPRPLMVPLVAWILWKRPEWRWPFAGLFVLNAVAVLTTGYGDEWLERLIVTGGDEMGATINFAPSALIGAWWLLAAIPLAAWAFWRGYPATSGVLLQPYWIPYYLLMVLADRRAAPTSRRGGG